MCLFPLTATTRAEFSADPWVNEKANRFVCFFNLQKKNFFLEKCLQYL